MGNFAYFRCNSCRVLKEMIIAGVIYGLFTYLIFHRIAIKRTVVRCGAPVLPVFGQLILLGIVGMRGCHLSGLGLGAVGCCVSSYSCGRRDILWRHLDHAIFSPLIISLALTKKAILPPGCCSFRDVGHRSLLRRSLFLGASSRAASWSSY